MYALYFPDEGRYSSFMTLGSAKALKKRFPNSYIVDSDGIEF